MSETQKNSYQCYFSAAAEDAADDTDFEMLVAKGKEPLTIKATSKTEAIAEFLNTVAPEGPDVIFAIGKRSRETLEPYIVCDPVDCS